CRKCLIYNVRKPEQDQSAIFGPIWQCVGRGMNGLFDNPNGRNDTCGSGIERKKNVMYGRDKMCPEAKNTQEGPLDDGIDEMADGSSEVRSVRCPR
ncbi:MAG: hypothetical protein ACN6NZ_06110, partial [Burkholderiales bacterium]